MILSAYTYSIQFRKSQLHGNADGLSRLPLQQSERDEEGIEASALNIMQIESLPVTADQLRRATQYDLVLSKVLQFVLKANSSV